jgi:hypothetical protein
MSLYHQETPRHQYDNQGRPVNQGNARVQHMRQTLTKWGYNVAAKGASTPRLMHAWNHFRQNIHQPHRGARSWNKTPMGQRGGPLGLDLIRDAHGRVVGRTDATGAGSRRGANAVADAGGGGGTGQRKYGRGPVQRAHARVRNRGGGPGAGPVGPGPGGGGADPAADPNNFPGVPGVDAGGPNTQRLLGRGMADTLAGAQFDPQIQELLTQIQQGGRDQSQHQRDISGWYDQVQGAQRTAGQRDTEASQHAHDVTSQALQGILQSLGGSRGAGVVGAAGLNDLTELASQGSSQDRYNADLAPLLQQEEAGAHSREQALGSQRASALNAALTGARGQRGQAKAKALMDIIQANNQSRQGNFQNKLAIQNAKLAAASLGLNADQTYAGIEAQRANTVMNAEKLRMAKQSLTQQQKQGKMNWAQLNYPDRQTVVSDAVGRAVAALKQGHGNWDPQAVYASALANLRGGGFKSARAWGAKGKYNKRNQQQIHNLLDQAIKAAQQQWVGKYPDQ